MSSHLRKCEWFHCDLTARQLLKSHYLPIKERVVNYEQASQIVKLCKRECHLILYNGSDLARIPFQTTASDARATHNRQPVIAVLGHRDHGKTTLLDALRDTDVARREMYGITQQTYCYHVPLEVRTKLRGEEKSVRQIATFIDTPG